MDTEVLLGDAVPYWRLREVEAHVRREAEDAFREVLVPLAGDVVGDENRETDGDECCKDDVVHVWVSVWPERQDLRTRTARERLTLHLTAGHRLRSGGRARGERKGRRRRRKQCTRPYGGRP